jgi:hypothetical protein
VHLTRNPGDDLYPVWSAGRDVMYTGAGFAGVPAGRGLLLELPAHGGTAELVFPDAQGPGAGGPRWLAGPAVNVDGSRVAYLDMAYAASAVLSDTLTCNYPEPLLDSAVLRIRTRGSTGPVHGDPSFSFRFGGRDPGQRALLPGPFSLHAFPFQQRYIESGIVSARPTWSPDDRVAFADGLRLFVWTPGQGSPTPVPGAVDAASPAWSPDGAWIAYARLERGDSLTETCAVSRAMTLVQHERTRYEWPRSVIVRVRPDGTDSMDLTEGIDPAWSPDGAWIFYSANGRIERIPANGGSAEAIASTEGGVWPSVSPDGERLVLMRRQAEETWDVWTVPLPR